VAKRITIDSNSKSTRFISCLLRDELNPEQSTGKIAFSRMLMEQTVFRETYGDGWGDPRLIVGFSCQADSKCDLCAHAGVCI
jgi:hypothetical protein